MNNFTPADVAHIAILSNIPITSAEEEKLAIGFTTTIAVVDKLATVDTSSVDPTHQVTGLENIVRADVVTPETMFTQEDATQGASRTYQGYIVVDQLIGE